MIHLPPNEVSTEIEVNLTRAIRNHFSYKNLLTEIELRRILYAPRKNKLSNSSSFSFFVSSYNSTVFEL